MNTWNFTEFDDAFSIWKQVSYFVPVLVKGRCAWESVQSIEKHFFDEN